MRYCSQSNVSMRSCCHSHQSYMRIYIKSTFTYSDIEWSMSNNTEEGRESHQNELASGANPALSNVNNGQQPHLNITLYINDECVLQERDRSKDEIKVLALRIWNSMLIFMIYLYLNEVSLIWPSMSPVSFSWSHLYLQWNTSHCNDVTPPWTLNVTSSSCTLNVTWILPDVSMYSIVEELVSYGLHRTSHLRRELQSNVSAQWSRSRMEWLQW